MILDFNLILLFFLLCHLQNGLSIYCDLHLLLLSEVSFIFKKFSVRGEEERASGSGLSTYHRGTGGT